MEKIKKICEDFDTARAEEMLIRNELATVADRLEALQEARDALDKQVTAGHAYADELQQTEREIDDLKTKRDEISKRLKPANETRERIEADSVKPISAALCDRFDKVLKAERTLRDAVDELQNVAGLLSPRRWRWHNTNLSPLKRSSLSKHGLPEIIKQQEFEYFESLKGEITE